MTRPSEHPRAHLNATLDAALVARVDKACDELMVSRAYAISRGLELWLSAVFPLREPGVG